MNWLCISSDSNLFLISPALETTKQDGSERQLADSRQPEASGSASRVHQQAPRSTERLRERGGGASDKSMNAIEINHNQRCYPIGPGL